MNPVVMWRRPEDIADCIEATIGARPEALEQLSGGSRHAQVWRCRLNGERVAVKLAGSRLATEGAGLRQLACAGLKVPQVYFSDDRLLVTEYIDNDGSPLSREGAHEAAAMLAALHTVQGPDFGLERDCMLGGLTQLNEQMDSWVEFYRHKRVVHAAWLSMRARRIETDLFHRIERLAAALDRWLLEPQAPSLLHGDLWCGNVLTLQGRVAAFIDPAPYYGHPEIELAFTTLFGGFGRYFHDRYFELDPPPEGLEVRRDLYLLHPLLVHACLFGSPYDRKVERILVRFGF